MKRREQIEKLAGWRNATDEELQKELLEIYREQFNLRMRHVTRQLENDQEIPRVRKQIARLKTVVRERQLARALAAGE